METTVSDFWNCFVKVQLDLLFAYQNRNQELIDQFFYQVQEHPFIEMTALEVLIVFPSSQQPKATLHILTKGKEKKKRLANQMVREAPLLENWIYIVGMPPYVEMGTPFSAYFPYIKQNVYLHQVFVHIHKLYNFSNKFHLHIYIDLKQTGVPKEKLKPLATQILFFYLGEDQYHKHISMIKIIRRKLRKVNYFPLRELKNLIQFKSPH